MKKHLNMLIGFICYGAGVVCSIYYGLWKMLLLPIHALGTALFAGELTLTFVIACVVKMIVSTTVAGLIWCIGYIAYNHFKGTEDPDWDELKAKHRKHVEEERQAL
ncbi:MAG: hypothetical protein PUA77_09335 [Lachnospiraceae bacterium]|nr:hypothetical protein [Agathobacter sp.]MDD6291966.1 hypothetical protein [Lachnospiraceae bacterium]